MAQPPDVVPKPILEARAAFGRKHGVAIVLMNIQGWTIGDAEQLFDETTQGGRPSSRTLVQQRGDEPSAAVRKRLAELQEDLERQSPVVGERRTAVLADSALTRGAITAWRWLTGANVRAFASHALADACGWLSEPEHVEDLLRLYRETEACLTPSNRPDRRPSLVP